MRISETGNKLRHTHGSSGYTILEIMAVITLVGIMTLIVYPQFTISPEKSEIVYIGKLLKTDLNLVKEESFSNKRELSIYFVNNGYGFIIDETEISRRFLQYQFAFDVPAPEEPEPETEGVDTGKESLSNPDAGSGEQYADLENEPEAGEGNELEPNQLQFTSNGKCNLYELSWQTMHFSGKLKVNQDGELEWSYARK